MNHPEGSIAEGNLGQEYMNFCTIYLNKLKTCRNRSIRNHDDQYESIEPIFESIPQSDRLLTLYCLTDFSLEERDSALCAIQL